MNGLVCTTPATSSAATLTVRTAPSVTTNPTNQTECEGSNAVFKVVGAGDIDSYKWQVSTNSGSSYTDIASSNSDELTVSNVTGSMSGYLYRAVLINDDCANATSTSASLTVNTNVAVTSNPSNVSACVGDNIAFTVAASGTNPQYQWQLSTNSGTSYSNIGGANAATYSINSITAAMDGRMYRCYVTGTCSGTATSNGATLTVASGITVNTQPTAQVECVGDKATFTTSATGGTISYQWQENSGSGFANIPGANAKTNSLELNNVTATMDGYTYRCNLTSTCGTPINTNSASLEVQIAPSITTNPSGASECVGDDASFSVVSQGSDLKYQWQESTNNGASYVNLSNTANVYSGVTTANLTVENITAGMDDYRYRVIISNDACASATSTHGLLTVKPSPSITTQPSNKTICSGSNTSFSIVASNATSYQWQVNSGSGWGAVPNAAPYSGVSTATLSITSATSSLSTNQYRCVVQGSCSPSVTSNTVTLTVSTPIAITTNPSASTICEGSNTSFTAAASGSFSQYQWQVSTNTGTTWTDLTNTGIYTDVNSATLKLTNTPNTNNTYLYRVVAEGSACADATSNTALLTVESTPSIIGQPSAVTICEGSNTSFSVSATGDIGGYQWQISTNSGTSWTDLTNTGIYSNTDQSKLDLANVTTNEDGNLYRVVVEGKLCNDVISNGVKLTVEKQVAFTTNPSSVTICEGSNTSFVTATTGNVSSYRWQVEQAGSFVNIASGAPYSNVTTNSLTITNATTALDGLKYRLAVNANLCNDIFSPTVTLTVEDAPTISTQPSNATICQGNNTSFSVAASGTISSYQWQVSTNSGTSWTDLNNIAPYSDTKLATLKITNAGTSLDGNLYRAVVLGNLCSNTISNSATLNVQTPIAITNQATDATVCAGTDASFSITATGNVSNYVWQEDKGTGYADLTASAVYKDVNTNKLTIVGATTAMDGYKYRVIVESNTCTDVNSNEVELSVETQPSISVHPINKTNCPGVATTFSVSASGSINSYQWQQSTNNGTSWSDLSSNAQFSDVDKATMTINNPTFAMNGFDYRVVVEANTCNDVTSSSANLQVLEVPTISSSPVATTICDGGNTSFKVTASAASITYQWQVDEGAGFGDVVASATYSGVKSSTLSISNAGTSLNGNKYRVVVGGTCSPNATSASAELTVQAPPSIVTNPVDDKQCAGKDASFTVAASGSSISLKWQENQSGTWADLTDNAVYNNTTGTTLTVKNVTNSMDGYLYRCVVSNATCTDAISNSAKLEILPISTPLTTVTATSKVICEGESVSLSASGGISGDGATIEWYTGANGTGTNFASGAGPISVSPIVTTTYYVRREGTCNNTADATITITVNPKPVAAFTTNDNCDGQITTFKNLSTVSAGTLTAYDWSLGDGSSSNLKNVAYTYSTTGTYNVELIATSNNGCKDTINQSVEIFEQPTANFTVTNVCLNEQTEFTDASKISGAASLSYEWEFGNGTGTSTSQNPKYTYNASGAYTTKLIVTSSDGCIDSVSKSSTVYDLPNADFDFVNACLNDDVEFTNKSKVGTGTLTYAWEFGDASGTSTATDPDYGYASAGKYNATLIATSNQGCKDTSTQIVETYPLPSASFTAVNSCVNSDVVFTNKTTISNSATLSYNWNFADGNGSNQLDPKHSYASANKYTVTLTATSSQGCVDSYQDDVDVYPNPVVKFSAAPVCDGFATSFINATTVSTSSTITYIWRFGDGDTSLRINPNHAYAAAGTYNATLIATSAEGCTDSTTQTVIVRPKPTASFRTTNVCLDDSASFQNLSTIASGTLTSKWNFGDLATSNLENPKHMYLLAGKYSVQLNAISNFGCEDSIIKTIDIYEMPDPDFSMSNVCDGEVVNFNNLTAVTSGTSYSWNFGDGFGSTNESPVHTYSKEGVYTVNLTATTANGCVESASARTITVHPVATIDFVADNVCDDDTVKFTNLSKISNGTISYTWNFGDKVTSTQFEPEHLYDTFGVYTVTLIATSDKNCIDSTKISIEVYPQPTAEYTVNNICEESFAEFVNTSILPGDVRVTREWDLGNGFSSGLKNPKQQYLTAGTYNTSLVLESVDGCSDTATADIVIWPNPTADFSVFDVCFGSDAAFVDQSTPTNGTIVNWEWNFGEPPAQAGIKNPLHFYSVEGIYEVELKVTTDSGCTDIHTQKIEVFPQPKVSFTANDACVDEIITFNNTSSITKGALAYLWDFRDGNKSTIASPSHAFNEAGEYWVLLYATSTDGCVEVDSQLVTINHIPDATITSSIGAFEFCDGETITLSVVDSASYTYDWNSGESTTNELQVSKSGNYQVSITSDFGCVATNDVDVTVFTRPIADAGEDVEISKGYSTELTGEGGDIYIWSPTATLSDSSIKNPIASPLEDTEYQLIVIDQNSCSDTDFVKVTVNADYTLVPSTVISPNGDGINDVWVIDNINTYPDCKVMISNRWGKVILNTDDYQNDWDGTYNGNDLPEGGYIFVIECGNGINYTGTISIIR